MFVDHGGDYPETYAYVEMMQGWLAERGYQAHHHHRAEVAGLL